MKRSLICLCSLVALVMVPLDVGAQQGQGRRGAGQGNGGQGRGGQGATPNMRLGSSGGGFSWQRNQRNQLDGAITDNQSRDQLLRMWDEEKLARDVYTKLASTSRLPVFRNILRAENQHMQAVAQLISMNGVALNQTSNTPGVFVFPEHQKLYQTLITEGARGPLDAAKVGTKIEEMDIADIRELIAQTNNQQIHQTMNRLMEGSYNHLRAFASQIAKQGGTYEAQYLPQAEFDAIANRSMNRRGQQGSGGGKGQGMGQGQGRGRGQGGRGPRGS